jgi:predicted nuclease of predicted toxin-antitoxin system
MRFLVDESTGASVTAFLRGLGHDVVAVSEATPQAEDPDILDKAVAESRIVVTNDKDFGELVFRCGLAHSGILLLRLKDESAANRVALVKLFLEQHAEDLPGNFVVVTESHVRIRKPTEKTP